MLYKQAFIEDRTPKPPALALFLLLRSLLLRAALVTGVSRQGVDCALAGEGFLLFGFGAIIKEIRDSFLKHGEVQ